MTPGPIVSGPRFRPIRALLERAADVDLPLLVLGETGTGKELAARLPHTLGPRRSGPFVAINCAAVPSELIESELFGHARGAFTGATEGRPGVLREAEGGTLFLDEIGELPAPAQAKLLRAIEERRIRPVGGTGEVAVDVRIVSATNREIEAEVDAGRFRRDLLGRIARLIVRLPPLRERIEDLPALAARFLDGSGKQLGADAVEHLCTSTWPGNVRELQASLQRAAFVAGEAIQLEPEHFDGLHFRRRATAETPSETPSEEGRALVEALEAVGGDVALAAARLGISRSQLYRRASKQGVRVGTLKK